MLQQQTTSCDHSNSMDVTIQFNVAANNISKMTAMFTPDTQQMKNQHTTNSYHCRNSFANGNSMHARQVFPFHPSHGADMSVSPYVHPYGNLIDQTETDYRSRGHQGGSSQFHQMSSGDTYSRQYSTSASLRDQQYCGNTYSYEQPSSVQMCQAANNSNVSHDNTSADKHLQMINNVQGAENQHVYASNIMSFENLGTTSSHQNQYALPQCQYATAGPTIKTNKNSAAAGSAFCPDDIDYEETKIAMRERDIRYRLEALKSQNCKEADDLEKLQETQTSLIDHERHRMLMQMACGKSSTDYINSHYNNKLVVLLETIDKKLRIIEKDWKVSAKKSTKRKSEGVRRGLPKKAKKLLDTWYNDNLVNPYPSTDLTKAMAAEGNIKVEQVRKWFANKRNRSKNNKEKMRERTMPEEDLPLPEESTSSLDTLPSPEFQSSPDD